MELNYEEKKFFSDKGRINRQYGRFAPVVEPYFREILNYVKDDATRAELLDRLKYTKMKFASVRQEDFGLDGYCIRMEVGKHIRGSIRISQDDYLDPGIYDENGEWVRDKTREELAGEACTYFFDIRDRADIESIDNHLERVADVGGNAVLTYREDFRPNMFYEWAQFAKSNKRLSAVHELTHMMANKQVFFLPKTAEVESYLDVCAQSINADPKDYKKYFMAKTYGNACVQVYEANKQGGMDFIYESPSGKLCEESIVDDIAWDVAENLGLVFNSREYMEYQERENSDYRPFVHLVGMWNLLSNGELRKRFVNGTSSENSRATDDFLERYQDLLEACAIDPYDYTDKEGNPLLVDPSTFDPKVIGERMSALLEYIDDHYWLHDLTPEQQKKYAYLRSQATDPKNMLSYLCEFADFDDVEEEWLGDLTKAYRIPAFKTEHDLATQKEADALAR